MSTWPVTTGTILASQSWPGPAAGPTQAVSAADAPARPRSWSRVMCSWIWVGCPARSGKHPGGDQPPARFVQRVVITLPLRPQVLRSRALAQRLQHRGQRGGALRGQVPAQLPRAAEGPRQVHAAVIEPVIIVSVGPGGLLADLLGQVR